MESAREKILEVATKLFAERGFAGVSIRELTVAANVNVSAISYYFSGKEGLYKEVIKGQMSWTMKILETVKGKVDLRPVERVKLYMEMQPEVIKKTPLLGKFMNSEMSNPTNIAGPIIIEHISKINNFLFDLIKEGIDKGDFKKNLDPAYCAITLAGILNFYFHARKFAEKLETCEHYNEWKGVEHLKANLDGERYIEHAIDIYLHGIAK